MSRMTARSAKLGTQGWLAILALTLFLSAAIWFSFYAWNLFPGTEIGTSGTIFLIFGAMLSVVTGSGLMALLFWSSRKGYDR